MILTPLVRRQLAIFAVLAVLGMTAAAISYLRVPTMLGIGRYTVTLELPNAGGLYRNANVTYRGDTIGQVRQVRLDPDAVRAELSLRSAVPVPTAGLAVSVRSVSAIGEQYVDLQPATREGPFLADGDVIGRDRVDVPQEIGPVLDQAKAMLASVPQDKLRSVIDESATAFAGRGPDLARLLDSTASFVDQMSGASTPATTLVQQLAPLLDTQVVTGEQIRQWASNVAHLSGQLATADGSVREILDRGPGFAAEADALFQELRPTLPLLLANLTGTGQVAVTYNAALEQVLVILPPLVAAQETVVQRGQADGAANVNFHLQAQDPAACSTGYLPADQRRDPTQTSVPETPADLFCKVPQDSKFAVRGSRNMPCLEVPGRRAPTPQICRSAEGYVPSGTNAPDELYAGADGAGYRHTDLAPAVGTDPKEPQWQQLLTVPNP
ncbi:MCE family protein [Rhodococcus tukisamuensis]|uniref:Phospholipid/cholesterol/gamma-HCH transport system substrate-binding protein n=1 Tax=Rhodococcus tukisamuensis TaxID=168276 RepID=A0A1G6R9Z7_9NOCA|nr:MlaD family protein [Rhodococcus tukisamuensis]SDD01460.1 phospholipid/cholesterol/gamma-HCH transport system substrate-binding protein [Rhodococcus tukisamuensis]